MPATDPQLSRPPRVLVLPCCRCLVEAQKPVTVSTGVSGLWSVTPPGGAAQPVQLVTTPNGNWQSLPPTNGLPQPKWVGPTPNSGMQNQPGGTYVYEMRIEVPKNCRLTPRWTVSGKFLADDNGRVLITNAANNNTQIGQTNGYPNSGWGFQAPNAGSFSAPLTPGMNTIRIEVINMFDPKSKPPTPSPTGLMVSAAVTGGCDYALTTDGNPTADPAATPR